MEEGETLCNVGVVYQIQGCLAMALSGAYKIVPEIIRKYDDLDMDTYYAVMMMRKEVWKE